MISDKTIVISAVAIADKIDTLKQRKEECTKWMKEGDQSEENQKFWMHHLELLDKNIQEHAAARAELINN